MTKDKTSTNPDSDMIPAIKFTTLNSGGYMGVSIDEAYFFLWVEYRGPEWWRFRLVDIFSDFNPKTAWITVEKPGDLRTSHKAKMLRDALNNKYGTHWRRVLEQAIGVVQDNEERWVKVQDNAHEESNAKFSADVLQQAEEILETGNPFQYILSQASKLHAGDKGLILVEWVSAVSGAVCKLPINVWTIGGSGKGKTHSKYTVINLLPDDLYLVFTSASPLSLFYYIKKYGENALDGILLFIDEVEASKYSLPMLRSLTSQTPILPRHLSVYDAEILDLKIQGRRAVWFTSVKTFGSHQIKNRFIHVNPDETEEQDERVFKLQDSVYRELRKGHNEFLVAKALTHLIVENTREMDVVVPFRIAWPFKQRRYLYPIFLSFIKTICKIRYRQRERDEAGRLVASQDDFALAKDLWKSFEDTIGKRVAGSALTVLEQLSGKRFNAMTHAELSEAMALGTRQITNICEELLEEGLVSRERRSEERGRPAWEYWRVPQPVVEDIKIIFGNTEMELDDNIFRWKDTEERPVEKKPEKHIIPKRHFRNSEKLPTAGKQVYHWRQIPPTETCEKCGKHLVEHVIERDDGEDLRRCQTCFNEMRRTFPNISFQRMER